VARHLYLSQMETTNAQGPGSWVCCADEMLNWGDNYCPRSHSPMCVEAKYMAISVTIQEVLFLRQIFTNLDHMPSRSTRMFEDNNGCMALATNPMTTGKTKHIDIRYHFIREVVKSGAAVVIEYCPATDMLAIVLTNCFLPTGMYLKHVGRILS